MIERIRRRFLYKRYRYFVWNLTGGIENISRRALLYYKTEPYFNKVNLRNYVHTNLWEINEMVRILNKLGYVVDLVDRSANDFTPEDKYDLFIGLGAGNSGKHFAKYGNALPNAVKVLYAAGPDPELSNKLVIDRYTRFHQRTGVKAPYMRTITQVDFPAFLKVTDAVFCFSEQGTFSYNSYEKHNKPVYSILPSTHPNIRFNPDWLKGRKRNKFICFAGHGFICKGVDILVEAFLETPELELHICGPDSEQAFFEVYGDKIKNSPNIHYEGFVTVASEKFHQFAATCSWIILNSASEGCATSVVTFQCAGLVPILNYESGIKTGDFGFMMEDPNDRIVDTRRVAKLASQIGDEEYNKRVFQALKYAQKYTQPSFTQTFSNALIELMGNIS